MRKLKSDVKKKKDDGVITDIPPWHTLSKEWKRNYAEDLDLLLVIFLVDRYDYKIKEILDNETVLSKKQRGQVEAISIRLSKLLDEIKIREEGTLSRYTNKYHYESLLTFMVPIGRKKILEAGKEITEKFRKEVESENGEKQRRVEEAISILERGNKTEDIPTWVHIMTDYTLAIQKQMKILDYNGDYIYGIDGWFIKSLSEIESISNEFIDDMDRSIDERCDEILSEVESMNKRSVADIDLE